MNHIGTVRIETERIILRPFVESDARAMFENWASDPEVTKFLTWPPHESAEISGRIVALWAQQARCGVGYDWCIEPKESGEAMGSLSAVRIDEENGEIELGYCLSRKCWGRGYMPEAVKAVIETLFRETGVKRITAKHDLNNPNSGRVMQKCGMRLLEIRRGEAHNNQGVCDVAVYYIDNPHGMP